MIWLSLAFLFLVIFAFSRKFVQGNAVLFWFFLLLKLACALGVGWLYANYYQYQGDTFVFFEQAANWFKAFQEGSINFLQWIGLAVTDSNVLTGEPRTRQFVIWMSWLYPLSGGDYNLLAIWLTSFQVMSMWMLFTELHNRYLIKKWSVLIPLFLIPSVTFWSAGLLKETVLLGLLSFIFWAYLRFNRGETFKKWGYLLLLFTGAFLLYQVKYYVVITLLPLGLVSHLFTRSTFIQQLNSRTQLMLYGGVLLIGTALVAYTHPLFYSGKFFEMLKLSHDHIFMRSAEARIYFMAHTDAMWFFVLNAPLAIVTGLVRPFLWESWNIFSLLYATETFVIFLLMAFVVWNWRRVHLSSTALWWSLAGFIYVVVLATVITLSTPNFGSLIRFKVAYLPVLVFVLIQYYYKVKGVRNL